MHFIACRIQSTNGAVTGIREDKFVPTQRQTVQGLAAAFANRGRHLEKVTHQTRQSNAVQNPLLTPGLTWLSDDRSIHNPDRPTDTFFEPVRNVFPKQFDTQKT